jgi:K+-sensing histidine kinase KdpD
MALGYHHFMLLQNSSQWAKSKPLWLRFGFCLLLTCLATMVRLAIHDYIQPNFPFQIFYISVIAITFFGGLYMGLLGSVLSTFLGFYFFIQPYNSFATPSVSDTYLIFVNLLTMLACVVSIEYLQRSIYSSSVLLKASSNNYKLHIRSENHLLNLKIENQAYDKAFKLIFSEEEKPVLWVDSNEIILLFYQAAFLIPGSVLRDADHQFVKLFATQQQAAILTYVNACLETESTIDFNFNWADASNHPSQSLTGRLNPITIDHRKAFIFTIV